MNPTPGVYMWSHGQGGVHHYRQAEPLRVAASLGVRTGSGNRLDNEVAEAFDTIQVHMLWDEHPSEAWEKLAAAGQHRLIFDIDDVMWDPDWEPFRRHYDHRTMARVWRNLGLAHVVTTPSPYIAEKVARVNPNVWVCPNTVPEYVTQLRADFRPIPSAGWPFVLGAPPVVIGYQGSPSHEHDFPPWLAAVLLETVQTTPRATLHFWGPDHIPGWPRELVGHTPWQPSLRQYYMSLAMDVGIGPLKPGAFNDGKSALRAIEYAALGIPCVLSAGRAYDGWVDHGVTGFLVPWDSNAWRGALRSLLADPDMREAMGAAARERAAAWTTEAGIHRWIQAWDSVGGYL